MDSQIENQNNKQKNKKLIGIIGSISLVLAIVLLAIYFNDGSQKNIKAYTKEYIIKYGNLKYPDTVKIESFDSEYESYKDEEYEIWKTTGRFTSENTLGMEVNGSYTMYIKYDTYLERCYPLWIIIDNNTVYGSRQNVDDLNISFLFIHD